MNTPRVVMNETKKAFRALEKKKDIEAAVAALSNLKGVGPAMASGKNDTLLENLGFWPSSTNYRGLSVCVVCGCCIFITIFHIFIHFLEREILLPVDELGSHQHPARCSDRVQEGV